MSISLVGCSGFLEIQGARASGGKWVSVRLGWDWHLLDWMVPADPIRADGSGWRFINWRFLPGWVYNSTDYSPVRGKTGGLFQIWQRVYL